jgi:hypothetical protein
VVGSENQNKTKVQKMATPKKKISYAAALKSNKAWATTQLKREAKQGKKGAPSQAAVNAAYAKGKDKLTTAQLNAIYEKFDPSPKDPSLKKKTTTKKK